MKNKKIFFFENFIKMLKPVEFDFWSKNLLGHKLSLFKKIPLFLPFLTKNSKTMLQMAIVGEKQKNLFFFWKLYQNAKNPVAFDFWSKDLLGHKLSFFSKKYTLFCPFWPKIQKPSNKWPFWVKNKKTFFFENFIKMLIICRPSICDQRTCWVTN